VKYSPLFQH